MEIDDLWTGWKIERLIGEGAFGKVYEITRDDFGHTYRAALKVIHIPQSQAEVNSVRSEGMDEESVKMYFQTLVEEIVEEFVLMSEIKGNTNIVNYEDHLVVPRKDDFGWDVYIRMELLTPLVDYIREHNLSVQDVIRLGIDICSGLEVCQQFNIIHRDIKPENIFVSKFGDFKLGDFGIARQLEKTSSGLSRKGTYSYMAPEVYQGQPYNSTVDIYSLGIVLYRFLNNNRTPFLPPYPERILYSDKEKANLLRMEGEAIPKPCNAEGELGDIVLKACSYDPAKRFQSAKAMKQELQSVLHNQLKSDLKDSCADHTENVYNVSSQPSSAPEVRGEPQISSVSKEIQIDEVGSEDATVYFPINENAKQITEPQEKTEEPIEIAQEPEHVTTSHKKVIKKWGAICGVFVILIMGGILGNRVYQNHLIQKKLEAEQKEQKKQYQTYMDTAKSCWKENNDAKVMEASNAAIEIAPEKIEPHIYLAKIYMGKYKDEAEKELEEIDNLAAKSPEAEKYADEIEQLKRYFDLYYSAKEKYNSGDYDSALKEYADAVKTNIKSKDAYKGMIDCYEMKAAFDEGEKVLKQASEQGVDTISIESEFRNYKENYDYMVQLSNCIQSDYRAALELVKSNSGDFYFQDNKIIYVSNGLKDGYSVASYFSKACFAGDFKNGVRSGQGVLITSNEDGLCYIEGMWKNNTTVEQATVYEERYGSGQDYTMIMRGNIVNGSFDGEVTMEWRKDGEDYTRTGVAYASEGQYAELGTTDDGAKIYVQSADGFWWSSMELRADVWQCRDYQ